MDLNFPIGFLSIGLPYELFKLRNVCIAKRASSGSCEGIYVTIYYKIIFTVSCQLRVSYLIVLEKIFV